MKYSVAIRTLGKAGEKYRKLLESLDKQTIRPVRIIVYIAEGYTVPLETLGLEEYVYVKKGMVAQRALPYSEIDSDYILFLDDDVELAVDSVETMYNALLESHADVIAPDVFANAARPLRTKILMLLSGRMVPRCDGDWAYKVLRTGGYSYNNNPKRNIYKSQTNAGPCFFCRKSTFLRTDFNDELWLDDMPYAMGEDQVMFYKMHLRGYNILTIYNSGIVHLDAGSTLISADKEKTLAYCDLRFKIVFWHRFILKQHCNIYDKLLDWMSIGYICVFSLVVSILKGRFDILKLKLSAIRDGIKFTQSSSYKMLPRVV